MAEQRDDFVRVGFRRKAMDDLIEIPADEIRDVTEPRATPWG